MDIDKDIQLIQSRNVEDLKTHYNTFKKELLKLDTHNNIISSVNRFREGQLNTNEERLMSLDKDLNSTRRQAEISENSGLKKSDWINVLRYLFLYLCLLFLTLFVLRGTAYLSIIVLALTVITIYIIGSQLYSFTTRDPNRWSVIQFKTKIRTTDQNNEQEPQCVEDDGLNEADEADKNILLAEIMRLKNAETQIDHSDKNLSDKIKEIETRRKEIQNSIDSLQQTMRSNQ
jgi:hypothetical protein